MDSTTLPDPNSSEQRLSSDCEAYRMAPCPFCDSEIRHIESLAKSFDPPRVYHEWHHIDANKDCWIFAQGGKIVGMADETGEAQLRALNRWNRRPQNLAAEPAISRDGQVELSK